MKGKVCVQNFDIIAVTETWIHTNSKNFLSEFKIEGYELIHEDRKGRKRERRGRKEVRESVKIRRIVVNMWRIVQQVRDGS